MINQSAVRPAWTPLMIALMVLGFVVWWPLGLATIAYIVWGDRYQAEDAAFRRWTGNLFRGDRSQRSGPFRRGPSSRPEHSGPTENSAFNTYRMKEIERLEQTRRRLDDEVNEFEAFLAKLRKARDRQEFDRFMHARHNQRGSRE